MQLYLSPGLALGLSISLLTVKNEKLSFPAPDRKHVPTVITDKEVGQQLLYSHALSQCIRVHHIVGYAYS